MRVFCAFAIETTETDTETANTVSKNDTEYELRLMLPN